MPSARAPAVLTRSRATSTWSSRRKSPFQPIIAARSSRCEPAEAKAMADRHFAGETERLSAGADLLDIEEAHLARLLQMNVEPNAAPRSDREDAVELPLRVAVNLQRIDAADEIGAVANGRIEQVEDARTAHHAALRERNDLHRCPITITLACGKHAFQLRKAAFEVNVDMGAQVAGTARDVIRGSDCRRVLRSTAASTAGSSYRFRCGSCASGPPHAPSMAGPSASCRDACGHRPGPAKRDRRRYRVPERCSTVPVPRLRRQSRFSRRRCRYRQHDHRGGGNWSGMRRASWPHSWRGTAKAAEGAERSLDHRRIEPAGDE